MWEIVLSADLPNSLRLVMALAVLLALLALWRLLRPGHVTWLPWAGEGRLRYASLGAAPPVVEGRWSRDGRGGTVGHRVPAHRPGDAGAGRPRRVTGRPRVGYLAPARPGGAGGAGPGGLACRPQPAEDLRRPGPHRRAARPGRSVAAGEPGEAPRLQRVPVLRRGARPGHAGTATASADRAQPDHAAE